MVVWDKQLQKSTLWRSHCCTLLQRGQDHVQQLQIATERVCRTRWSCLYIGRFPSCCHPITVFLQPCQNFYNIPRMPLPRIPPMPLTTLSIVAHTPQTEPGHYVVLRMNTEAIPIANAKPCFRLREQCGSTLKST